MESMLDSGLAEVAAILDPALPADDTIFAKHPSAKVVTSFCELLDADLDGIVIATPSALHAAQAIAALERGIPVFCQKPLGRNKAETAAAIRAASEADCLLGVDLSYRFTEGMLAIRDLVKSGGLGKISAIDAVFHNSYGPDKPWFYRKDEAGGGCLLDLGIHLADLALWCLDFPEIRRSSGWIDKEKLDNSVESHASGLILLDHNIRISLATSWRSALDGDAEIRFRIYGSEGSAEFSNISGSFTDFTARHFIRNAAPITLAEPPDNWGGKAALAWLETLSISGRFDPQIRKLEAVAGLLDDIYQSAESA